MIGLPRGSDRQVSYPRKLPTLAVHDMKSPSDDRTGSPGRRRWSVVDWRLSCSDPAV